MLAYQLPNNLDLRSYEIIKWWDNLKIALGHYLVPSQAEFLALLIKDIKVSWSYPTLLDLLIFPKHFQTKYY